MEEDFAQPLIVLKRYGLVIGLLLVGAVFFFYGLSQFMAKPHESHWKAAKRVLRYLKGTIDFGVKYTDKFDVELAGYSDFDWTGNLSDRKSTTCYAFKIGLGVVSWSSKKQPTISLSTTKAEYKALCGSTCEAF